MAKSKVWFITGCSTGFGRELAIIAARKGDKVVGTLRREEQMTEFEALNPSNILAVKMDVTSSDQIREAVQKTIETFGRIDVLVNNAGYGSLGPVEAISEKEIRRQFAVNVFGPVELIKAFLPHMRKAESGHIINITSIAGLRGSAGIGIYNGSKFALEGIGEALAKELRPFGIHVTNVEPGPFRTDWAGRSATYSEIKVEGYETSAERMTNSLKEKSGKQIGDPVRAAHAMYALAELSDPPIHLPLGAWAYKGARMKCHGLLEEIDKFEYLGLPTDYPESEL